MSLPSAMSTDTETSPVTPDDLAPYEYGEIPAALVVDTPAGDTGTCAECGATTFRPPGTTPGGRQRRIPKRCEDCSKTAAKPTGTSRKRAYNPDIAQAMEDIHTMVGLMLLPKDPELGLMLVGEAKLREMAEAQAAKEGQGLGTSLGEAWAKVAAQNPAVMNVLAPLTKGSAWSELAGLYVAPALHVARKPRANARFKNFAAKLRIRRRMRGQVDGDG